MLSESEKQVLGVFGKFQLIRKDELRRILTESGVDEGIVTVNKLSGMGYLKFIEAVGSPCYTITQEGIRAIKT